MSRVTLVYGDHVGERMGGVGIRAVELARTLAADHDVRLAAASHDGAPLGVPVSTFAPHRPAALQAAVAGSDAVVAQPQWPRAMGILERSGARLVFDLYDPEVFGTMEHHAGRRPAQRRLMTAFATDRVTAALRLGHHVACATERQRDLLVGALLAGRGLTPAAYDEDPSLRSRVDVVAYGVPARPPERTGAPPPGERLGVDGEIVLWNGGVWSWFDAPTAIRAMAELDRGHLVFMGVSSAAPAVRASARAREVARRVGLLGRRVHFHDEWVPYQQRADWLLGAACALSTHADHLEARYSSRTRLLDCFWAGLPVVCTAGDELADRVERDGLGETVPAGDAPAVAAALERVLDRGRDAYAEPLARAAADHAWPRVTEPLRRWIARDGPPSRGGRLAGRQPGELARTALYTAATAFRAPPRVD